MFVIHLFPVSCVLPLSYAATLAKALFIVSENLMAIVFVHCFYQDIVLSSGTMSQQDRLFAMQVLYAALSYKGFREHKNVKVGVLLPLSSSSSSSLSSSKIPFFFLSFSFSIDTNLSKFSLSATFSPVLFYLAYSLYLSIQRRKHQTWGFYF